MVEGNNKTKRLSEFRRDKTRGGAVRLIYDKILTVNIDRVAHNKGTFMFCAIGFVSVYVGLIVLVCYLQTGFWPNRLRGFDYFSGVWESATLPVPIIERYQYIAFQPLFELEAVHPTLKSTVSGRPISIWRFTTRTATVTRTLVNTLLISVFLITFINFLRISKRVSHSGIKGAIGYIVLSLTVLGAFMGLGASLGATCCGGVSVSVVFYLMGMSPEVGLEAAKWADPVSRIGLLVLIGSIVYQSLVINRIAERNGR